MKNKDYENDSYFNKKHIIVTGAAGGMGTALVQALTKTGALVTGIDKDTQRLEELSEQIGDSFKPVSLDLSKPLDHKSLNTRLPVRQPVYGFVHLAGLSVGDSFSKTSDDDWEKSFQVHVHSARSLLQAIIPKLNAYASVVLVGSPVGVVGARKASYATSKAALQGLTMSLARELGPIGIRVNLLLPGTCITPMTNDWSLEKREAIAKGNFQSRLFEPEEVASVISFLLSPESSMITGSVIDATSGGLWGH